MFVIPKTLIKILEAICRKFSRQRGILKRIVREGKLVFFLIFSMSVDQQSSIKKTKGNMVHRNVEGKSETTYFILY